MPPSGYSTEQGAQIRDFLVCCASALVAEAERDLLLADAALTREIFSIERLLDLGEEEPMSVGVLILTLAYYKKLLVVSPTSLEELEVAARTVAEEFREAVLSIHVPPVLMSAGSSVPIHRRPSG